jgi:nitrate reductase gamma subunit
VTIAEFVDGPLWYFSAAVFVIGVSLRLIVMVGQGYKKNLSKPRASAAAGAIGTNITRFIPHREFMPRIRLTVYAGYIFHIGLFLLLIFAAPHIDFYEAKIFGFDWPAMPHWAFLVTAEMAFLGLLILWLHRIIHPVTRIISTRGDHLASILTFIVMLTGCLALARSYEPLRVFHLFTAELLLIYFPFSMLMHTFTVFLSRGYIGAHFGRRGVNI